MHAKSVVNVTLKIGALSWRLQLMLYVVWQRRYSSGRTSFPSLVLRLHSVLSIMISMYGMAPVPMIVSVLDATVAGVEGSIESDSVIKGEDVVSLEHCMTVASLVT